MRFTCDLYADYNSYNGLFYYYKTSAFYNTLYINVSYKLTDKKKLEVYLIVSFFYIYHNSCFFSMTGDK